MTRRAVATSALALVLLVPACGGGGGSSPATSPPPNYPQCLDTPESLRGYARAASEDLAGNRVFESPDSVLGHVLALVPSDQWPARCLTYFARYVLDRENSS